MVIIVLVRIVNLKSVIFISWYAIMTNGFVFALSRRYSWAASDNDARYAGGWRLISAEAGNNDQDVG